ncbi:MAG TPA: thiamine phosphate synthase [Chloroflexota bacterium]|nr:thiamine phosphate synthase [Chloroflexota bacterium]
MPASRFQLHLVTEPRRTADELIGATALALDGGADWVQLRNKTASAAALYDEATELQRVAQQHGALLSINDRVDVALAVGAAGVHLASQSLPVDAAVNLAAGRLLVGRSVHSLSEARAAATAGADYLTFGHVFPTTSHPGLPPRGLTELAAIVQAVDVPVLAIGGITTANLDEVLGTGCAGIAVISAILSDADPSRAAGRLRAALDRSTQHPRYPFPTSQRESHAAHRQPTTV